MTLKLKIVDKNYHVVENVIRVGIGEYAVAKPPKILTTILGSCVAIILYDCKIKVGGLAHIVLPYPRTQNIDEDSLGKYASTAIPLLLSKMQRLGADRRNVVAGIVGGASLLPSLLKNFNVGKRNAEVVSSILIRENIPVVIKEIGGRSGRTLYFILEEGVVVISYTKL